MSNLLHILAIDSAVADAKLGDADQLLSSEHCTMIGDSFNNERDFYDVMEFLRAQFSTELYDLVTSYGERQQRVHPNLEVLREDGWYVTVLSSTEFDAFKAGVIRALDDLPWMDEIAADRLPVKDTRSWAQKLIGKSIDTPTPMRLQHDEYEWTLLAESTVKGDYYVITSTM